MSDHNLIIPGDVAAKLAAEIRADIRAALTSAGIEVCDLGTHARLVEAERQRDTLNADLAACRAERDEARAWWRKSRTDRLAAENALVAEQAAEAFLVEGLRPSAGSAAPV